MTGVPILDFREQNPKDWKQLIDQLFPLGPPYRAVWQDQEDIIRVLNHIGSIASSNYLFFASSGGMDLTGAVAGAEPGTIELKFGDSSRICKIASLAFESFMDGSARNKIDYQWSYFRIELTPLASLGLGHLPEHGLEEHIPEARPGEYMSLAKWDNRYEEDAEPLPKSARFVTRLLNGSMVIFQKISAYNDSRASDTGIHNHFSPDLYKIMLEDARLSGSDQYLYKVYEQLRDKK